MATRVPVFTDDYNRANNAVGLGTGWADALGGGELGINSNQAYNSTTDFSHASYATASLNADQYVTISLAALGASGTGRFVRLILRRVDSNDMYFATVDCTGGNALNIYLMAAGVETLLTSTTSTVAGSDEYVFEALGSSLFLYKNGSQILSTSDATHAGGNAGAWIARNTPRIDNFECGNLFSAYSLTAAAGSYALSGQLAGLKSGRQVAGGQGAYALTGQAATLRAGRRALGAQGSYLFTGQAAALRAGRKVGAAQGSYALTGQAAGLRASRKLVAAQGSYSLTGFAAGLVYGSGAKIMVAETGSYAISGQSAALRTSRKLAAAAGSYLLTGRPAALRAALRLTAGYGVYTLNGQAALLAAGDQPVHTDQQFWAAADKYFSASGDPYHMASAEVTYRVS